jgi:hypothetical protein
LGKQRFGRNAKHPLVDGMGGPPWVFYVCKGGGSSWLICE